MTKWESKEETLEKQNKFLFQCMKVVVSTVTEKWDYCITDISQSKGFISWVFVRTQEIWLLFFQIDRRVSVICSHHTAAPLFLYIRTSVWVSHRGQCYREVKRSWQKDGSERLKNQKNLGVTEVKTIVTEVEAGKATLLIEFNLLHLKWKLNLFFVFQ